MSWEDGAGEGRDGIVLICTLLAFYRVKYSFQLKRGVLVTQPAALALQDPAQQCQRGPREVVESPSTEPYRRSVDAAQGHGGVTGLGRSG